ncbi:MAG: DUF87 domain-containing protein [Patescibacteria group bacterium]|nr:DUF87 domain-containing protein [Patescibacteria group bacterium]
MKFGTNLEDNSVFELDLKTLLKTHTFIQSMTGGGKTSLILKIVEQVQKERPDVQMVFLDDQEEFTEIPLQYPKFKIISKDATPKIFSIDHAKQIGIQTRRLGKSVVVNLHDFEEQYDREAFVGEFLRGFSSLGKEVGNPAIIVIDEADVYIPTKSNRSNIPSRYPIINLTKRARKLNISVILSTQYLSEVEIRARRECANRICGKTTELRDRKIVAELLGEPKVADELFDLKAGNFFVRGEIFKQGVSRIYVEESNITRKQAGVADEELKKLEQIQTKLSAEEDLFEKAVENKNDQNLVEILQNKIADLEKQLADQKIKTAHAYNDGFLKSETQWKEKGRFERLLK